MESGLSPYANPAGKRQKTRRMEKAILTVEFIHG
jgi:hypothetical protein